MEVRKIEKVTGEKLSKSELIELCYEIEKLLSELGFKATADVKNSTCITISGVRVNTKAWGYNISPYTGRRGNILNFYQWALINYALNVLFDLKEISANIKSLGGLFVIREGTEKARYGDWEHREYDNVGSVFNPIMRVEAWLPENSEKFATQYANAIRKLEEIAQENQELLKYIKSLSNSILSVTV